MNINEHQRSAQTQIPRSPDLLAHFDALTTTSDKDRTMSSGPRSAATYNSAAPSNYVAGIGRGAMGFTTRSDIGPARPAATITEVDPNTLFGKPPPGYVAGRGRGMGDLARTQGDAAPVPTAADVDRMDYSESNYDEFAGYGERLFSSSAYEEDDAEADQIYDSVDQVMELRRKRTRERALLQEQNGDRRGKARIATQFADLKRDLATVSAEQWDAIPEVGDHSLKLKQSRKKETFMPLPDDVRLQGMGMGMGTGTVQSIDVTDGMASVMGGGRNSVMTSRLDKISGSVGGQTVVDPTGYLTSLDSIKVTSEAEIGDIKKARVLLQSVTTTNPQHGPGWIAAARVEEYANKPANARKVILEGCEKAPQSEDVWLEAARLHAGDRAKIILNNAVRALPNSVKIYLQLADLETSTEGKKGILRKGLESVPNSVTLWKAAIELESLGDAKILLSRAIECIPQCIDMYLALAKLETHANARKVLNLARENIPSERKVWIYAATLEEVNGNEGMVRRIIEKMVLSLTQLGVVTKREDWLEDAVSAEQSGALVTAAMLLECTACEGVDEQDLKNVLMDDIQHCLTHYTPPALHCARSLLELALRRYPNKKSVWLQGIILEQEHGTADTLEERLLEAVKAIPEVEIVWLIYAKKKWTEGNVHDARQLLMAAYQHNPASEDIYLAAVKLEWESNEVERARKLLAKAKEHLSSPKILLKYALFEWEQMIMTAQGELDSSKVLALLAEGLAAYPTFEKFHLMSAQLQQLLGDTTKARLAYQSGLKACPACTALWRGLLLLEEQDKGLTKARSIGEMARLKLPKCDAIYIDCLQLERRHGNSKLYSNLLAKAFQDCPVSGALYAELLLNIPKNQYKSRTIEALKKVPGNALVLLAIGRLFESSFVAAKAVKYYERALAAQPRLGDAYVYYYACLVRQANKLELSAEQTEEMLLMEGVDDEEAPAVSAEGTLDKRMAELRKRCEDAGPNAGELWCSFTKQTMVRRKTATEKLLLAVEKVLGPAASAPSV